MYAKRVWVEEEMGPYKGVHFHALKNAVGDETGKMIQITDLQSVDLSSNPLCYLIDT